ncbi:MAG: dienelactone hydrolase family protein [Acidimicrobiia bacterium]|nr:dienelactone hydrolase family protein [Acidimicrobiia bacterium]MDQ3499989.1 dienelactone hydrolase family protein [Actinomycetota bacterium]
MAIVAIFHSALGVRPGLVEFANKLKMVGREVHIIDQYDRQVFDDYDEAGAYVEEVGFPDLMAKAIQRVADLPDGFVAIGFSNGAGMAEFVAANRPVSGVVMASGALPLETIGITWPEGVPAQIHSTVDDPRREQDAIDSVKQAVEEAGGTVEVFDYPGSGHLFADSSMADEYQPAEAELMLTRIKDFLDQIDQRLSLEAADQNLVTDEQ